MPDDEWDALSLNHTSGTTGGGRYILTEPSKAEIAFVVIDAYQGQGVGTLLMRYRLLRPERSESISFAGPFTTEARLVANHTRPALRSPATTRSKSAGFL